MTRHPHADLIKAWAEDTSKELQVLGKYSREWHDTTCNDLLILPDYEYRFKPKPDVVRWVWATENIGNGQEYCSWANGTPNMKVIFDGETGKLIKAEVIE